jgi:hypothetical protein
MTRNPSAQIERWLGKLAAHLASAETAERVRG